MIRHLAALALVPALVGAAHAQGAPGLSLGVGAGISNDIYIGDNDGARALPLIEYRSGPLAIGTNGARLTVAEPGAFGVDLLARPRFSALDDPDAPELAGIDRDFTIDLGVEISAPLSRATAIVVTGLVEVTGEHDGQEVSALLRQTVPAGRARLGVEAGFVWLSADLSAHLYGVRPGEAAPGRPAYAPGDAIVPRVGAFAALPLAEGVSLTASARVDWLPEEATDSPIVEEDIAIGGFIGLGYRF